MDKNSPVMYPTHHALSEDVRRQVITTLDVTLAASIDLWTHAKQAHWNVKGPHFIALHKLFDEVATKSQEYIDSIAERITQLGGVAEGTLDSVAKKTPLPQYSLTLSDGEDHVKALATSLGAYGKHLLSIIDTIDELNDVDTVDILTEASRGIDESLWFVEAHVQSRPITGARSQPRAIDSRAV